MPTTPSAPGGAVQSGPQTLSREELLDFIRSLRLIASLIELNVERNTLDIATDHLVSGLQELRAWARLPEPAQAPAQSPPSPLRAV